MPPKKQDSKTLAAVRLACLTDLYALVRQVLNQGMPAARNLTDTLHKPLCAFMQTTPYRRNLYLMQRGSIKTGLLTVAANVQRILRNPEIRILISSNKAENAQDMLREIKGALVNPWLLACFPDILYPDPARQAPKWTESDIIVKRKGHHKESTVETIGVTGELTSKHYDHMTFDDIVGKENSQTREARQQVKKFLQVAQSLADPGATQDYVGCLPADAQVLLERGEYRSIEAIKAGDRVWAADEDGSLGARTVVALVPQGDAQTLTIVTATKTVRATPNHPFLALRENRLQWTRADQLIPGEYIVAIKEIPDGLVFFVDPRQCSADFLWLFGFLLGDGWASTRDPRHGYVAIALSSDEVLNARVQQTAERWFPGVRFYRDGRGSLRADSRQTAIALQELGLVGTAKTKRLPAWTLSLPPLQRRALLRGFCEADGTRVPAKSDLWRVEIANQELIEDLRRLADLAGVRTGQLRTRKRFIRAPHSAAEQWGRTWDSSFNFSTVGIDEFREMRRGHARRRVPELAMSVASGLRPERVVSVTPNPGTEPVYDLTVDGTPSFFANGLAVHNTPWDLDDAWAWLLEQRKEGLPVGLYEMPCWQPDPAGVEVPGYGRVTATFPERFFIDLDLSADIPGKENLLFIRKIKGHAEFAAQYLLRPSPSETAYFPWDKIVVRPRRELPPADLLWTVMTVDPAISTNNWSDYSAIAVTGFDSSGIMHILDLRRGKWEESELIAQIFDAYARFPTTQIIGFEAIAWQKMFRHLLVSEGEKRGHFLPVVKLERDTKQAKNTRIRALEPYWSAGDIVIAQECPAREDFKEEAERWRPDKENTHDDLLDAVVDSLQLRVKGPSGEPERESLYDDPDMEERAEWEQSVIDERRAQGLTPPDRSSLRLGYSAHRRRQLADQEMAVMQGTSVLGDWNG